MSHPNTLAWAAVSKRTGRVLRDLRGRYAVYTREEEAIADCPSYGVVKRVRITVVKGKHADQA